MRLVVWTIVVTLLAPGVSAIACGISCVEALATRPLRTASCHEASAPANAVSSASDATCHRDAEPSLTAVTTSVRPEAMPTAHQFPAAAPTLTSTPAIVLVTVRPPPGPARYAPPLRI